MSTSTDMVCSSCGAQLGPGEAYCEACGAPVVGGIFADLPAPDPATEQRTQQIVTMPPPAAAADPVLPCANCGSVESADGYCNRCGARMPVWRDRFTEQPAPWLAGVCDRGILHARNEDAMALGPADPATGLAGIVVCDGVTTATDSDIASLAAARAARGVLELLPSEFTANPPPSPALLVQRLCQGLVDAGVAAQQEARVAAERVGPSSNPPSCTFVAALVHRGLVAAGWVGDSRAYWLPDEGEPQQLSADDSFAAHQIAQGVSREEAESGPQAHAITRWLGVDSPDAVVRCSTLDVGATPGWLLVCSDGLWNYASSAADMAALVTERAATDADPLAVASALVAFANERGGHDNITAALARLPLPPAP